VQPAPVNTQSEPAAPKASSAAKPKPVAPPAESVQALPPAIDIHPAPKPRAPRAQPGAAAAAPTQAQTPPPAPARPRSLFDFLFGN